MAAAPLRMTAKGSYSPYPIIECFVLPMAGPEEESVRHTGEDAVGLGFVPLCWRSRSFL